MLGERIHKCQVAAEGLEEEEPVAHTTLEISVLWYMHAVNFAAWDAKEGAVEEDQPR
jgi:hypothetical protein